MGLRIIGRQKPTPPVEISEAELLAGLTRESSQWPQARGFANVDIQKQFIDKFQRIKARITAPGEVAACAQRVRDHLAARQQDGGTAHAPVDVATLLELL